MSVLPRANLTLSLTSIGLQLSCLISERCRGNSQGTFFYNSIFLIFFCAVMQPTTFRMKSNLFWFSSLKFLVSMICGDFLTKASAPKLVEMYQGWISLPIYSQKATVYDFTPMLSFKRSSPFLLLSSIWSSKGDLKSRLLSQFLVKAELSWTVRLRAEEGSWCHLRLKTLVFSSCTLFNSCAFFILFELRFRSFSVTFPACLSALSTSSMYLSSQQNLERSQSSTDTTSASFSFWYFTRLSMFTFTDYPQIRQFCISQGLRPCLSRSSQTATSVDSGPRTFRFWAVILSLMDCSRLFFFSSGVPKNSSPSSSLIFWMGSQSVLRLLVNSSINPGLHIILSRYSSSNFFLNPTEFINRFSTSLIDSPYLLTLMPALFFSVCSTFGSTRNFSFRFTFASSAITCLISSLDSFVETSSSRWKTPVHWRMKLERKARSKSLKRYSLKRWLKKTNTRYRHMYMRSSWNQLESSLRKLRRQSLSVSIHSLKKPMVLRRVLSSMKLMQLSHLSISKFSFKNQNSSISRQDFSFHSFLSLISRAMLAWQSAKYWLLMMLLRQVEKGTLRKGLKTESESQGRHHSVSSVSYLAI